MSKAVHSDGSNQVLFEEFLVDFDYLSLADRAKAISWFSELKENGKARLDDIKLAALVQVMAKFFEDSGDCPAILKKYCLSKLKQGQSGWEKGLPSGNSNFPWDSSGGPVESPLPEEL